MNGAKAAPQQRIAGDGLLLGVMLLRQPSSGHFQMMGQHVRRRGVDQIPTQRHRLQFLQYSRIVDEQPRAFVRGLLVGVESIRAHAPAER